MASSIKSPNYRVVNENGTIDTQVFDTVLEADKSRWLKAGALACLMTHEQFKPDAKIWGAMHRDRTEFEFEFRFQTKDGRDIKGYEYDDPGYKLPEYYVRVDEIIEAAESIFNFVSRSLRVENTEEFKKGIAAKLAKDSDWLDDYRRTILKIYFEMERYRQSDEDTLDFVNFGAVYVMQRVNARISGSTPPNFKEEIRKNEFYSLNAALDAADATKGIPNEASPRRLVAFQDIKYKLGNDLFPSDFKGIVES